MLNKGRHILQAVNVLDDILCRMHGHQAKNGSMLHQLRLVSRFRKSRAADEATSALGAEGQFSYTKDKVGTR